MTDTAIPAPTLSDAVAQLTGLTAPAPAEERGTLTGLNPNATFIDTQKKIAFMLLWIMIGVIAIITLVSLGYSVRCSVAGETCTTGGDAIKLLTDSMSPIFTAMIGLVGSVVGFYFGSKST